MPSIIIFAHRIEPRLILASQIMHLIYVSLVSDNPMHRRRINKRSAENHNADTKKKGEKM